jgi:hypothetical protein
MALAAFKMNQESSRLSSKWLRFLAGSLFGVVVSMATLLLARALVPESVPTETASSFFFAASAVNATLLVAIAVTISVLTRKYSGHVRRAIMLLFIVQLSVVFVGLVTAGIGILVFNPSVPLNASLFSTMFELVLATWVIGFVLLVAGIWATSFDEG